VVIDAYSGGGLMTAMAARRAKRAYGIELNAEASACAESLKKKNNLANMANVCGDAASAPPAKHASIALSYNFSRISGFTCTNVSAPAS